MPPEERIADMHWNLSLRGLFLFLCILLALGGAGVKAQNPLPVPSQPMPSAPPQQRLDNFPVLPPAAQPAEMPPLGPPSIGMAVANPGLTLAQLEQLALQMNPTLCQAAMRIQAANGQLEQVGLYPNPVAGYSSEEMGTHGTAGKQGAFVSQEIVTAGKLKLNRAVVSQEVLQAQWAWQAQMRRVLNDVRSNYYEVLYAQQTIEINEQLVHIGEENLKTAENLFAAKEVSRVDVLQAGVEADTARIQLENARNRHQSVWRRLTAVIGMPEMAPVALAGRLEDSPPQFEWNTALEQILAASPQLAEARAGMDRARCQVDREYAERTPNVNLRTAIHYNNEIGENIAAVEVGVPLPIFNRNQGNIAKAQSQLIAAQNEVRRVELELRQKFASIFEQYSNANGQVQKYAGQILPNSVKTLDLVRSGYQQGEFNYQNLLISQRTYFQANLSYLESLRQLRLSAVALEGLLLSGGLQSALD
jgi:cobalt-zinc-cadmium efflux system outer membrane protein